MWLLELSNSITFRTAMSVEAQWRGAWVEPALNSRAKEWREWGQEEDGKCQGYEA